MTERKKIAQIIAEHLCPQGKAHKTLYGAERKCYSRDNFAECEKVSECVDALIEAGIGDCAALTEKWRAMLETQAKKTEEAEHRAEVAERALLDICKDTAVFPSYMVACAIMERLLKKAEKELAEGKKDE